MNNKTSQKTINKIKSLGKNIAVRRKELKYSQNKFSEKINISREHLAKIETAKRAVSLDLLIEIAEELNTTVKELIDF